LTSILKRLMKRAWRLASPVRKALVTRFDQHLDRHLQNWFNRTEQFHAEQQRAGSEMQLVADAMVRELVRLQVQINGLEETIANQAASNRPLSAAQQRDAA
jgi:hypothetical protein